MGLGRGTSAHGRRVTYRRVVCGTIVLPSPPGAAMWWRISSVSWSPIPTAGWKTAMTRACGTGPRPRIGCSARIAAGWREKRSWASLVDQVSSFGVSEPPMVRGSVMFLAEQRREDEQRRLLVVDAEGNQAGAGRSGRDRSVRPYRAVRLVAIARGRTCGRPAGGRRAARQRHHGAGRRVPAKRWTGRCHAPVTPRSPGCREGTRSTTSAVSLMRSCPPATCVCSGGCGCTGSVRPGRPTRWCSAATMPPTTTTGSRSAPTAVIWRSRRRPGPPRTTTCTWPSSPIRRAPHLVKIVDGRTTRRPRSPTFPRRTAICCWSPTTRPRVAGSVRRTGTKPTRTHGARWSPKIPRPPWTSVWSWTTRHYRGPSCWWHVPATAPPP